MHLRDDDALGAVDDEGAVRRHERHVAHVDVLLLDVLYRASAGLFVHVEYNEPKGDLERRGIGHATLLALLDVIFRRGEGVVDKIGGGPSPKIFFWEDATDKGPKIPV